MVWIMSFEKISMVFCVCVLKRSSRAIPDDTTFTRLNGCCCWRPDALKKREADDDRESGMMMEKNDDGHDDDDDT